VVVPPVAVGISEPVVLFPDAKAKTIEVSLRGNAAGLSGELKLEAPQGWRVAPASAQFKIGALGEESTASFTVTPPAGSARATLRAVATVAGKQISSGMLVIEHPDNPPQTVFPPSTATLVRTDVRTLAKKVGYIMGAGDAVPRALEQLGCEVTLLTAEDLARGDLNRFDAIVAGVRAYNVRSDLIANQQRLLDYMQQGGTLVVQYNTAGAQGVGPYPIQVGASRVTVEEAPVTFPNPRHVLLNTPNKIGPEDFAGWIQERGLNFPSQGDPRYETVFESHDPGEQPLPSGNLYARYGKGAYVYTAYAWFRELPAGVPGAFRIFANFLSAGKSAP
jgi:hypothetical protein